MWAIILTTVLLLVIIFYARYNKATKAEIYACLKASLAVYQKAFLLAAEEENVVVAMKELTELCAKLPLLEKEYGEAIAAGSAPEALDAIALKYSQYVSTILAKTMEVGALLQAAGKPIVDTKADMFAIAPDLWEADQQEIDQLLSPFENTMMPVTNAFTAMTPFTEAFFDINQAQANSSQKLTEEELNLAAAKKVLEVTAISCHQLSRAS